MGCSEKRDHLHGWFIAVFKTPLENIRCLMLLIRELIRFVRGPKRHSSFFHKILFLAKETTGLKNPFQFRNQAVLKLIVFVCCWAFILQPLSAEAVHTGSYLGLHPDQVWYWLIIALFLFICSALLFLMWTRSLKKEVARRRATESALVKSVTQYQNLIQALPHGIIELDSEAQINYCSKPVTELLGYESRELIGRKLFDLLGDQHDADNLHELLEKVFQEKQHQSLRLSLRDNHQQAHLVQFDCDYSPIEEGRNQIIVVTDLTRQERAEEALAQSERIYQYTFENIQVGIAHLTENGVYRRVNGFFCEMLGYSAEELCGKSYLDFTYEDDIPNSKQRMEDLQQKIFGTYSFDKRYVNRVGEPIWVLVTTTRLSLAGEKDSYVSVIQDIDSLKKQQQLVAEKSKNLEGQIESRTGELKQRISEVEQLNSAMLNLTEDLQFSYRQLESRSSEVEDVNQELESFAYSVSHDLRAPLRHVQGFAQILRDSAGEILGEKDFVYLKTILDSAERMGQLIDDLLAFSRAGRSELQFRTLDTGLLLEDVIKNLEKQYPQRKISWQLEELLPVEGDLGTLRQVFHNLMGNAVKYSEPREQAEISISCEEKDDELVFCIADNGVGFDPQLKHKLYAVFSRLHRADQFEGTGIGLANVKRIVKRHGGQVWAESDGSTGSCFYFSLPKTQG